MKKKKNALKENPMMGSKKNKKIKVNNVVSDDENEIKRFIFIILGIAVIMGIIYGITELVASKKDDDAVEVVKGSINYDKVSVGTLLNRPYDEYYVLVYDSESKEAVKYSAMMTTYKEKDEEDSLKIYYCDLGNSLNKKYYNVNEDNKSNKKAQKVEDFDFGDLTLLHIKDGKVSEYIEDYKTIQEKLK